MSTTALRNALLTYGLTHDPSKAWKELDALEAENKRLREALKGVLELNCACARCIAAREALTEET